jgi:hypothetical protein
MMLDQASFIANASKEHSFHFYYLVQSFEILFQNNWNILIESRIFWTVWETEIFHHFSSISFNSFLHWFIHSLIHWLIDWLKLTDFFHFVHSMDYEMKQFNKCVVDDLPNSLSRTKLSKSIWWSAFCYLDESISLLHVKTQRNDFKSHKNIFRHKFWQLPRDIYSWDKSVDKLPSTIKHGFSICLQLSDFHP